MTREQIIALAKQCGAADSAFTLKGMKRYTFTDAALEAFFHAAQRAEREACAKVCDSMSHRDDDMGAIIGRAIRNRGTNHGM